jgi:hypothetical protein
VAATISAGRIIWACLGPRGGYKRRPAVAISSPDADGNFYVIGGSTLPIAEPALLIELPSSFPVRHPLTKLKRPTFLDLGWIDKIHTSSVDNIGGLCPATLFVDIQRKARILHKAILNPPGSAGV